MGLIIDTICKGKGEAELSEYLREGLIPLATRRPFRKYEGAPPRKDVHCIETMKNTQNSIIIVAPQGYGKTIMMMRLIYYFHLMGWKIVVVNPKGGDHIRANDPTSAFQVLPFEIKKHLPISNILLSFGVRDAPASERKACREVSLKLRDVKTIRELRTLDFSFPAARYVTNKIKEDRDLTIEGLLNGIEEDKRKKLSRGGIHRSVAGPLQELLMYYWDKKVFSEEQASISIAEEWRAGRIPVINSYNPNYHANSYMLTKVISEVYNSYPARKKVIFLDDAQIFAPNKENMKTSESVELIGNRLLALGRKRKWDVVLSTQTPDLINEDVQELFIGHKIFGKVNLGQTFSRKVGVEAKRAIHGLIYYPKEFINQVCTVFPDNIRFWKGFPLGPILGHPINLKRGGV